jgi:catechol 2,3-dioxygenase-like lactoylglutathione lyase family enzyme
MRVDRLDHLVLRVAHVEVTTAFCRDIPGMTPVDLGEGRTGLHFGAGKLNLHKAGQEFEPKATHPVPGSADICLVADCQIDDVSGHLTVHQVTVELGPVERTGATGPMTSVYVRDPDGNLVEISSCTH